MQHCVARDEIVLKMLIYTYASISYGTSNKCTNIIILHDFIFIGNTNDLLGLLDEGLWWHLHKCS